MPFIVRGDLGHPLSGALSLPNAELLDVLGRQLRAIYENVLDEPLPDRLVCLTTKLEELDGGLAEDQPWAARSGVPDEEPEPGLMVSD
jgi:hypothetical protein